MSALRSCWAKAPALEHVRVSPNAADAVLVEEVSLHIAAGGRYRGHFASFGAKLARMELEIALEGEGAQAHLSGVSVLDGKRHSDVTTHVIHRDGQHPQHAIVQACRGRQSAAPSIRAR